MESKGVNEKDALIDLESGSYDVASDRNNGVDASFTVGQARTVHNGTWTGCVGANEGLKDDRNNQHMDSSPPVSDASTDRNNQHMDSSPPVSDASTKNGDHGKSEGEEKLGLLDSSGGEKTKKKRSKKPPRPPRPPSLTPLDISDQKLLNELNELAVLKRARIERMKALKKMKNAKQGSSSTNLCPLIITIIFCVVILWQGLFARPGTAVSFHGSPESSIRAQSSLISIRLYKKNHSNIRPCSSTTAAPNNEEAISSRGVHNQARRIAR